MHDTVAWHFNILSFENNIISGSLDSDLEYIAKYIHPKEKGFNRFRKKREPEVMNAVYLHSLEPLPATPDSLFSINTTSIQMVRYNKYAEAISLLSYIIPAFILPVAGIILLIVASNSVPTI